MNISENGKKFIKGIETLKLKPYIDDYAPTPRVEYSIGYGHQIQPDEEYLMQGITEAKANELFDKDIVKYANAVANGLKVPVKQSVFDALVSFCYNIGVTGFAKSTLLKLINENTPAKDIAAFWLKTWIKPISLIKRRAKEVAYAYSDQIKSGVITLGKIAIVVLLFFLFVNDED